MRLERAARFCAPLGCAGAPCRTMDDRSFGTDVVGSMPVLRAFGTARDVRARAHGASDVARAGEQRARATSGRGRAAGARRQAHDRPSAGGDNPDARLPDGWAPPERSGGAGFGSGAPVRGSRPSLGDGSAVRAPAAPRCCGTEGTRLCRASLGLKGTRLCRASLGLRRVRRSSSGGSTRNPPTGGVEPGRARRRGTPARTTIAPRTPLPQGTPSAERRGGSAAGARALRAREGSDGGSGRGGPNASDARARTERCGAPPPPRTFGLGEIRQSTDGPPFSRRC